MLLLLRLLLLIFIIRAVLMLVRGVMAGMNPDKTVGQAKSGGQLVRDPVCGVYVTPSQALTVRSGVGTAYFCSEKCRQAWQRP